MAARGKNRQFPTAYKLKAIKRVERGEGVLPVARELVVVMHAMWTAARYSLAAAV